MESEDPERLADHYERDAQEMERRTEGLQGEVQDTRDDWRRKRQDSSVPGAIPEDGDESEAESSQTEGSSDSGREAENANGSETAASSKEDEGSSDSSDSESSASRSSDRDADGA